MKFWYPRPTVILTRPAHLCALVTTAALLALAPVAPAQDLPSLDQLFAPQPAASPTPSATPASDLPEPSAMPSLGNLAAPTVPAVPTVPNEGLGEVIERQQRRRDMDAKLSQIREQFAQGNFQRVLELVNEAEQIEQGNPSVKFYKDWAEKKIRTGEGARGAIINNPRLNPQSTPDPAIPTPRTMRTPAPVATPGPVVPTPDPLATPLPTVAPVPVAVPVPTTASSGWLMDNIGPILVAVVVALVILGLAAYLLSKRAPLPKVPQYTPVPILPNMLATAPVEAPATMAARQQKPQHQDPQTLVIEDDEPVMAKTPPPMSDFPGVAQGAFGSVGLAGMAPPPAFEPAPASTQPSIDALPTVDVNHDDTMYAIEEDPYVPLPDPVEVPEQTPYKFHEDQTLDLGTLGSEESTMIAPGPLPPSAFGMEDLDDVERTIPVLGPLPPSKLVGASARSMQSDPVTVPEPAPATPAPPVDAYTFDPEVTLPAPASLPPSRFDVPPPPAVPVQPQAPAEDVIPSPFLDLPMDNEPAVPKQLLGVFPGKARKQDEPVFTPPAPAPVQPLTPVLPPSPPGSESVIDLGSLGINFTPSAPPAPPKPEEPLEKATEPPTNVLAGLASISLADAPTPVPGQDRPGDASAANSEASPYQVDSALAATKTMSDFAVGEESIYGNPSISESEQSARMVALEMARGDKAAASGDWKKAVHYYAIAASIQSDHPELMEKLRIARQKKRELEQ